VPRFRGKPRDRNAAAHPPRDGNISASSWGKSKGQLLTGVNQSSPILCPDLTGLFGFAPSQGNLGGVGREKESFGLVKDEGRVSLVWGHHHHSILPAAPQRWPDPAQGSHSKCHRCRAMVPLQRESSQRRWERDAKHLGVQTGGCSAPGMRAGVTSQRRQLGGAGSFAMLLLSIHSLANVPFPPAMPSPGGGS